MRQAARDITSDTLWTIRPGDETGTVEILDQTLLPHTRVPVTLRSAAAMAQAIRTMQVRGAPLIGVAAAWGMALAMREDPSDAGLEAAAALLLAQRPTAVNLRWAVEQATEVLAPLLVARRADAAWALARRLTEDDARTNAAIGDHGLPLLADLHALDPSRPVEILTHCNAGWLATTAWGTATAPIYRAHAAGIAVHVWVSETRPRNQGAALTAWELAQAGVPHTVIADNAAGHLLRTGRVDLCLVGADRVAANGDVINKVGTYLKALAARASDVPLHVAFPASTIDWRLATGDAAPIEERDGAEVTRMAGHDGNRVVEVTLVPPGTAAANPAFDLTPAELVSGLLTERGRCPASARGLRALFPEAP